MSKGQRGNKEVKKPRMARPAVVVPVAQGLRPVQPPQVPAAARRRPR